MLEEEAHLSPHPAEWLGSSFMFQALLARAMVSHCTLTLYFIRNSNSFFGFFFFFFSPDLIFIMVWLDSQLLVRLSSLAKTLFCNFLQPYSSVYHIRYSCAWLQQQYTRGTILLLPIAVVCPSLKCPSLKYFIGVSF